MTSHDQSLQLRDQVLAALAAAETLHIRGSGSKAFLREDAAPPASRILSVSDHTGVTGYEPSELVITVRAGTPLRQVETVLAEHGQMLAFEPPGFAAGASMGGTLACGLSGPRRPYTGSARDFMLGCRLLNGQGQILSFGGQVIKNVAGFDITRLMAGSYGTLGVLLEVSLKVLPRPEAERTLVFDLAADTVLARMSDWSRGAWPLSALAYDGERVLMRLSGAEAALKASHRHLGGEVLAEANRFWQQWREQELPWFHDPAASLWRLSLAPASPPPELPGHWHLDWGGALRWLKTTAPAERIFAETARLGGHARCFRSAVGQPRQPPLPAPLAALQQRLRTAFDPHGVFQPD